MRSNCCRVKPLKRCDIGFRSSSCSVSGSKRKSASLLSSKSVWASSSRLYEIIVIPYCLARELQWSRRRLRYHPGRKFAAARRRMPLQALDIFSPQPGWCYYSIDCPWWLVTAVMQVASQFDWVRFLVCSACIADPIIDLSLPQSQSAPWPRLPGVLHVVSRIHCYEAKKFHASALSGSYVLFGIFLKLQNVYVLNGN